MDDPELASLRAMLVGPERQQIEALQARIDDKEARAEDLAEVLPRVLLEHADDPHFTRALTPPLERAITTSVQQNPKPLADALFPVMGPAIRKAVSAGLAGMVESLNRTLEHSLSGRSVRWRIEAWRTGKPFAEVVLTKTLLYRGEQAFLIDVKSGLLLQHVRAGMDSVQDADLVSGMLTAIRDFVRDSFRVSEGDSLESLKVGELSVWIEPGPHALVAAVIRGTAPREYRRTLQDAVETIHLQFGHALEAFEGDASTLDGAKPALEACLQSQYRVGERKPATLGAWLVFGAVALSLLAWAGFAYRTNLRTSNYVDRLRTEPGLVVLSTERRGGKLVVSGLRDPLAVDPATLVAGTGLDRADVVGHWAPYAALDSPLVLARARAALRPADGVELSLNDGVLSASGTPSIAWVADARHVAPLIAGLTRFDAAGAVAPAVRAVVADLELTTVLFVKGSASPAPRQDDALRHIIERARELDALAGASGQRFRLDVVGHADTDGPDESNVPLSRARATLVAGAIGAASLAHLDLAPDGVGSRAPVAGADTEADKQKNRCVTIHVVHVSTRS